MLFSVATAPARAALMHSHNTQKSTQVVDTQALMHLGLRPVAPMKGSASNVLCGSMLMNKPLSQRLTTRRNSKRGVPKALTTAQMNLEEIDLKSGPVCPCPTWDELTQLASGADDSAELAMRAAAAKLFNSETAWEVCDDPATLESCSGIFGDLGQAVKVSDEHVRLLVDCLLRGQPTATITFYDTFTTLPPFYRREQEIVCTAIGAATLAWIRDEQEIIASVLKDALAEGGEDALDAEGKQTLALAEAVTDAVDQMSMVMPVIEDVPDSKTTTRIETIPDSF